MPATFQLLRSRCRHTAIHALHASWSGFRTLTLVLALFALVFWGTALQAQSTIPPAFAYQIVGNGNGLVLDVLGAQTAPGTPVDIALSVPSASNQTWQFAAVDAQHYQIASSASGKVLDVYGAQTAPGTRVDIATAVPGAANQEWQLVQLPYYEIVSRATGMVLDVYGAQTYNGAPVDIANTVAAAPNQQWKLVSAGTNTYQIVGNRSGKVLDVYGAQTAQGTPVDIAFAVPGASNQTWQLVAVYGQYYQIVSTASGKVLDVVGAGTAPGTRIDIATAVPGAFNQEWQFVELPYFQIVSKASGQVLDVYAAQTNDGTPVDIAPAVAGAPNQEWMLVPAGTPLPPAVFKISGQVLLGGAPFPGVSLTLTGSISASAISDSTGRYSFNVTSGGNYTVTPSLSGYTFTPPSVIFNSLTNNGIANFSAPVNAGGSGGTAVYDPPSIVGSYTAPVPSLTCDNISGTWTTGATSITFTQTGTTVSGAGQIDDGPSCGVRTYSLSGQYQNGVFSIVDSPTSAGDSCYTSIASTYAITLSDQSCSTAQANYTTEGESALQTQSRTKIERDLLPTSALLSAITSNPSIAAQAPDATGSAVLSSQTPRFSIQYASYIPVDHIDAPTACYAVTGGNARDLPFYKLYKGDANRSTYRTTQSMFVIPNTKTSNNFRANTGPTRNYSLGSPVNGSTLDTTPSTTDIYNGSYHGADEDNVQGDCWLWNDRGQASTSTLQGNSVTYPSNTQASVNLYGTATDPLEPSAFGSGIKWNITALLDSSSSSAPNLQLSYTHTCYPAHIVKVNGQIVYDYKPPHNALWYLFGCLTDVIPEISGTKNVAVPAH